MRQTSFAGGVGMLLLACACGQATAQSSTSVLTGEPQFPPRPRPLAATQPATASGTADPAASTPEVPLFSVHEAGVVTPSAAPSPRTVAAQVQTPASPAPAMAPQAPDAVPPFQQQAPPAVQPQTASPSTQPTPPPGSDTVPAPAAQTVTAAPQPEPARTLLPADTGVPLYALRAGDTVDVLFRYTPEFNDEVVIGPDGRASLKSVGTIQMAGLTVPELQRLIVRGSTDKLVNPEVTVSLKDFERPNVVVAGEVDNPQRIELRRPMTVLQAILIAGGPKDDAALGRVLLFRRIDTETAEVHVLKLGKYDAQTRAQNDLLLQPNDMILVRHDKVSRIDRYVKLVNLGVYLNPIGNNGIF